MKLTQQVVITTTGHHATTAAVAARASLGAYLKALATTGTTPAWEAWIDDHCPTRISHTADPIATITTPAYTASDTDAAAVALVPTTASQADLTATSLPLLTDPLPHGPSPLDSTGPYIQVAADLTTPAAVDTTIRALWDWALPQLADTPEPLMEWLRSGMPMSVDITNLEADDPGERIHDHAGLPIGNLLET